MTETRSARDVVFALGRDELADKLFAAFAAERLEDPVWPMAIHSSAERASGNFLKTGAGKAATCA